MVFIPVIGLSLGIQNQVHLHKHMVPLHSYILQGELSIEYETSPSITQTISKGDAFLGVTDVWHNAKNTSDKPTEAFVVFMGAEGLENTINRE